MKVAGENQNCGVTGWDLPPHRLPQVVLMNVVFRNLVMCNLLYTYTDTDKKISYYCDAGTNCNIGAGVCIATSAVTAIGN